MFTQSVDEMTAALHKEIGDIKAAKREEQTSKGFQRFYWGAAIAIAAAIAVVILIIVIIFQWKK